MPRETFNLNKSYIIRKITLHFPFEIKIISLCFLQSLFSCSNKYKFSRLIHKKQSLKDVLQNRCSSKFCKFLRKTPVLVSLFNKVVGLSLLESLFKKVVALKPTTF